MNLSVRKAEPGDVDEVCGILVEAARWLETRGQLLWRDGELQRQTIVPEIAAGLYFVAHDARGIVGTLRYQLEDPLFWPDLPRGESAFLHRLAVRRQAAGGAVSSALLGWAIERTRSLGRRYLRLDCEVGRERLRALYERQGFRHHSDRHVGPYFVARYELAV